MTGVPVLEDGAVTIVTPDRRVAINPKSENLEYAREALEYVADPAHLQKVAKELGTLCAVEDKNIDYSYIGEEKKDFIPVSYTHLDVYKRQEPLTLVGPKGLERVVNSLRVIAPELPFSIKYIEITEPEQTFEMNGYRLKAFRVNHNVTCLLYTSRCV